MMKRVWLVLAIAGLVLAFACEKNDDVTNPDDTEDGGGIAPDEIDFARTFPPLLANGADAVQVVATVVDSRGRGLSGVKVNFSTTEGTIDGFALSGDRGKAIATLTSEASAVDLVATVTAEASTSPVGQVQAERVDGAAEGAGESAGEKPIVLLSNQPLSGDAVAAALRARAAKLSSGPEAVASGTALTAAAGTISDEVQVPMLGLTLALRADPAALPGDGIRSSRIEAKLLETTRRVPVSGQEIRFGTTAGTITGAIATDESGIAEATLTSEPGAASAAVTAYYGGDMTATVTVPFEALALTLEASSPEIPADGVSEVQVAARLRTASGAAVTNARIEFTTTLGTIGSPVATDEGGVALTSLRAGSATGTAAVRASFGEDLTQSVAVTFTQPPETASLLFHADPVALAADGISESRLIADALDADGNPMRDGTVVVFSIVSGGGQIVSPVAATSGGRAEATYVAGTTAGDVRLRATSGAAQAEEVVQLAASGPGGLILETEPGPSILADGLEWTEIRATVTDRFGNPVPAGTAVDFSTSRGVLFDAQPTDASGVATVRLRSERFVTGTARVIAKVGSLQQVLDVRFVSEAGAHVEALSAQPPAIGVRGAGDHETSTVIFQVQDRHGIPVDEDHAVVLDFHLEQPQNTDATLYPESAATDARGLAWTTVNAGFRSGTVGIAATSGSLYGEPIFVAIHGGKPDERHFSISFERLNIAGLVYDGIRNAITARVGDRWGNPVPDSTRVWFRAEYGLIQGSEGSTEFGEATVQEITAGPHPQIPGGDGLVLLTAQTVDSTAQWIETAGHVMWSGPTIVEILEPSNGFDIPNGGSINITYRVRDANFNPLVGGTSITMSATAGELGGDVGFTLPDTQSRSYTMFGGTLSDDDPETNEPESVTITVTVTSQNGNRAARVTGIKH